MQDRDEDHVLTDKQRRAAIVLAEETIRCGVEHGKPMQETDEIAELFPKGERATFVTVNIADQLNGCIGRLQATRPIYRDIIMNAFNAAFRDHRFPPVEREHLDYLNVHISVLNPLEPIPVEAESDLWEFVEPGKHGVLLETDDTQGTFLPSVWEKCPDRETFLLNLKKKAGLAPSAWPSDLDAFRYTVDEFDRKTLEGSA